jgi:hypothetical protein
MTRRWPAYSAIAGFTTVALACLFTLGLPTPRVPDVTVQLQAPAPVPAGEHVDPVQAVEEIVAAQALPVAPAAATARAPSPLSADAGYYSRLRARLRWVQTRVAGDVLLTPDLGSRMLLAKSAAQRAGLSEVGLSFKDVYGIINAETSWVPRSGASKDGTPNLGIAQFEPATAKALGVRNPHDPVEAVHAAALHMKEAARWSSERLEGLDLGATERAEKLREGVSVFYNLSTRGRNRWNGTNAKQLPRETQRHIVNTRAGVQEAALIEAQLQAGSSQAQAGALVLASVGSMGS